MPAKRPPPAPDRLDRHLGRRLARRRHELGLTRADVARRIGVSPATVTLFEGGLKTVGAAELVALAETLGVSVAWFFAEPPPAIAVASGAAPRPERVAEAERFLAAYVRVADAKVRRDILGLVKAAGAE